MVKRALLLALLTSGCSALGLTDGLDQEGCTSCADLNAIDPPPACMSWQCIDGFCALDVEDLDEDGVPSAMCVPDDVPSDCDEADPEIGESFDEACDGKDNDCDERVDESLFRREVYAELPDVEALSLAPHDAGFSAVFAQRSAEDGLRVLRRFRTDDRGGLRGPDRRTPDGAGRRGRRRGQPRGRLRAARRLLPARAGRPLAGGRPARARRPPPRGH